MAVTIERALKWWARDKPEALALHYDGETLTFGELHAWASRIAAFLGEQGVRPGDRVAMVANNALDYAVLIVGTVLSGAIAAPSASAPARAIWRSRSGSPTRRSSSATPTGRAWSAKRWHRACATCPSPSCANCAARPNPTRPLSRRAPKTRCSSSAPAAPPAFPRA
ncbi:AMP-binding protein [Novosphingobium resinovorum]